MRALLFAVLPLLAACGGPDAGEILSQSLTLTLTGVSSRPQVAAIGKSQGGLGVSRAFVAASALSLLPCSADIGSIVLDARGYDLLTDPPPSEAVTTAVDDFCGLQLDLDPVSGTGVKGVPKGATLYVQGVDAGGNDFELVSTRSHSLRFDKSKGFGSPALLLGFDVSGWLPGLPIRDPNLADAQADAFNSQLQSAVALYADANENGALDDDEATPLAVATPSR